MTMAAPIVPNTFAKRSKISKYLPVIKFNCKISIKHPKADTNKIPNHTFINRPDES